MKVNWKAAGAVAAGTLVGLGIAYVLREKATPRARLAGAGQRGRPPDPQLSADHGAETVVTGPRKEALNERLSHPADYLTPSRGPRSCR
jgi:hypothetical protein